MANLLDELRGALQIDKNDLDSAWIEHPVLFDRVSTQLTLAISLRDGAKLELNDGIAEVDAQIRDELDVKKMTERAIEQEINLKPRIKRLRQEYNGLVFKADQWAALKESYQQRSYALKHIVELYVAGYFQSASSGGAIRSAAVDGRAAQVREEAGRERRERLKRKERD